MVPRRYPEAKSRFQRGLTLAPRRASTRQNMALAMLGQGDVESVRADSPSTPGRGIARDEMLAYISAIRGARLGLHRPSRERVLELGPELFDDDHAAWGIVRATSTGCAVTRPVPAPGRTPPERLRGASAGRARRSPALCINSVALAYLGRDGRRDQRGQARRSRCCRRARTRTSGPTSSTSWSASTSWPGSTRRPSTYWSHCSQMPYTLTPAWLRIDPLFDPIRKHPRFVRLVQSGK